MLEKEREFYASKHADLLSQHSGKFAVIKGDQLVGAFETIDDALSEGARRFGLQPFLVRQVTQSIDQTVEIPALALGILSGNPSRPI